MNKSHAVIINGTKQRDLDIFLRWIFLIKGCEKTWEQGGLFNNLLVSCRTV